MKDVSEQTLISAYEQHQTTTARILAPSAIILHADITSPNEIRIEDKETVVFFGSKCKLAVGYTIHFSSS